MKALDVIKTANRNLLRSKLRTFLTISAIFVGAFTLTLTNALGDGAQDYLDRQLGNVSAPGVFYVTPKVDENPFASSSEPKEYNPDQRTNSAFQPPSVSNDDIERLKKVDGVETVRPYQMISTEYIARDGADKRFTLTSVNPYTSLNLDLAAGRLLKNDDKYAVILPENYLKSLGFNQPADAINQKVNVGYKNLHGETVQQQVTVVGVMKKSLVTEGEFHVDDATMSAIASQQTGAAQVFAAIVKFKDADPSKEAQQKEAIAKVGNYSAISLKEQVATITNVVSAITTALSLVGFIALFAASFGIINTLLMSVYERTQEIGLMKALGMHRRAVFSLFAFEAVLVGFWGSVVAVAAGYGVSQLVNSWASTSFLKDFDGFTLLLVSPTNALSVVALIMTIAFLAGTLPAIKASRLNPIDALRSE